MQKYISKCRQCRNFKLPWLSTPLTGFDILAISLSTAMAMTVAQASAAPLKPEQFGQLARSCAPGVALDVLRAVAGKESGLDPLAIHNNTQKLTVHAKDQKTAVSLAQKWIAARDSIDLGLMQIHTSNLGPLGLTVGRAFDACTSIAAGAAVLKAAYQQGTNVAERQAALLIAFSRYNTGRPLNGVANGYALDVMARTAAVSAKPIPQHSSNGDTWNVWASTASPGGQTWFSDYPVPGDPSFSPQARQALNPSEKENSP